MSFDEFMSLTPGTGVIFDGKDGVVTKVKCVTKNQTDSEVDNLTGERMIYKSLLSARELEVSYVDARTGRVQHLYPIVFPDCPDSPHNNYILSRMKVWDPFVAVG